MNGYNSEKKTPKYNSGRFLFMFDPISGKMSAIYDENHEVVYTLKHPAFKQVYEAAAETLKDDAILELKEKLKSEPTYVRILEKIRYNRTLSKK
ncbi:MAG: hypothetical protein IJ890_07445 [Clostridia bacterium]|nr:hypothetical protein [Clostridia bacterium]